MKKPIKPIHHGIIDYLFSGTQIAIPLALGLNKKAQIFYLINGVTFGVMNALTDTPVGVSPVLTFKTHQKADAIFLTTLAVMGFAKFIARDDKALEFYLGFLSTAISHYALTDYNANKELSNL